MSVAESAGEDEDEEVALALAEGRMDLDVEGGCLEAEGGRLLVHHRPSTCLASDKPKTLAKNVKVRFYLVAVPVTDAVEGT